MLLVSPPTAHAITPHAGGRMWVIFVQVNPPGGLGPIWIEGVDGSEIGRRLSELARLNAFEAMLIGLIETPTPTALADQIKHQFDNSRTHDNWFLPTVELLGLIQQNGQQQIQELLAQTHPGGMSVATVDVDEIAKIVGVSTKTIRRMVDRGEIPCMRAGRVLRFVPADVIAALQRRPR